MNDRPKLPWHIFAHTGFVFFLGMMIGAVAIGFDIGERAVKDSGASEWLLHGMTLISKGLFVIDGALIIGVTLILAIKALIELLK